MTLTFELERANFLAAHSLLLSTSAKFNSDYEGNWERCGICATDLKQSSCDDGTMSTADSSLFSENGTSTQQPCIVEDDSGVFGSSSSLASWQGYIMFIGLAIVAFGVARGSLAVRHRIYQDKVNSLSA